MNALQYKDGKFWLVPDVPEKPTENDFSGGIEIGLMVRAVNYKTELKQALSNSIEVAEESRKIARDLIFKGEKISYKNVENHEGKLYPIEGLKYKTEERGVFEEKYPNGNHKGIKVLKQVAIINK